MTRKVFLTVFALLGALSVWLAVFALANKKWDTVTAALSLLIAIVAAWVAYESFYRQDEARRPQLTLSVDADSRYNLLQLVCKNSGETPAYNIEINWNIDLIHKTNTLKCPIRFNNTGIGPEILVLNPKETASTWVTDSLSFYDPENGFDMSYSGAISFQESLNSTKRVEQLFSFSLQHTKGTLAATSEDLQTMVELQKIPKSIEALTKELQQIRQILNKKNS